MATLSGQIAMIVHEPIPRFEEERRLLERFLEQLPGLSVRARFTYSAQMVPGVVGVLSRDEALDQGIIWQPSPRVMPERAVTFDFLVPVDLDALALELSGIEIGARDAAEFNLESGLTKFAGDFILAAAIADPGAFQPSEIVIRVEGQIRESTRVSPSSLYPAREAAAEKGWPTLGSVAVDATLAWLHEIPGFEEGVPSGDLGRAVSALSRLLGYDSLAPEEGLMWCMVGLESLYAQGHTGLSEQLIDKGEVFLGPLTQNRRSFKHLYAHRSKFIHGDFDFPLSYTPYDAVEAFSASEGESYGVELLATAFLLATLQRMSEQGLRALRFHWFLAAD